MSQTARKHGGVLYALAESKSGFAFTGYKRTRGWLRFARVCLLCGALTYAGYLVFYIYLCRPIQVDHSGFIFEPGLNTTLQPLQHNISIALSLAGIGAVLPSYTLDPFYEQKVNCQTTNVSYRCQEVVMTKTERELARTQWKTYVDYAPVYPSGLFTGKGIVIAAGGAKLFLSALVTVRALRDYNCTLPVEIWFNDDEFPSLGVRRALREMDVRPRYLGEFGKIQFGSSVVLAKNYQTKLISLVASSFEEVLFLDADNLPLKNPSYLFELQEYRRNGVVLWSDLWLGIAPQEYVDILGLRDSAVNSEGSFESGQLLFNKMRSWRGLMAAVAFNFQSEVHYVLPTCGMCGAGDKETFGNALRATNVSYFKVIIPKPDVVGARSTDGFRYAGMLQYSPEKVNDHLFPLFFHHMGLKLGLNDLKRIKSRNIDHTIVKKLGLDVEFQYYDLMVRVGCTSSYKEYFTSRAYFWQSFPDCRELGIWLLKWKEDFMTVGE